MPSESLTNGDLMEAEDDERSEDPVGPSMAPPIASAVSCEVDGEALEPETMAVQGRAAALIAAARAMVSEEHLKQRLAARGHPCSQCDRVFMSMQGLRSHERSHSAMALFSKEDKYSCQYCQFVSPFRHKYVTQPTGPRCTDKHIYEHISSSSHLSGRPVEPSEAFRAPSSFHSSGSTQAGICGTRQQTNIHSFFFFYARGTAAQRRVALEAFPQRGGK